MTNSKGNADKKGAGNNNQQKKSNLALYLMTAVALCLVAAVIIVPKLAKGNKGVTDGNVTASDANGGGDEVQVIEAGESLVIPISEVSSTAQFYPVEVDGTRMEVLAVEDSEGNIRTAFNTCQICYASGRGYYVQDGDVLVCQNCGNGFTVDQVEIQSGGCNPWPIFAENKTVTEDSIEISYDFLKKSKEIFANWKTSY